MIPVFSCTKKRSLGNEIVTFECSNCHASKRYHIFVMRHTITLSIFTGYLALEILFFSAKMLHQGEPYLFFIESCQGVM